MISTIHKTFVVMLGLSLAILSANNSFADDKVDFDIAHSMNALITYGHCKANTKIKDGKITVLEAILEVEEDKVDNLSKQNKILVEDYSIKEIEAGEWKAEYMQCTEALVDAKKVPWWKFDLKSVLTGTLIPLIIKFAWII